MKIHIDFTKADKSSFDGTGVNTYSVDEANALGQHGAKPLVIGSAICEVCSSFIMSMGGKECMVCGHCR